ncbi:Sec-independent protein translocase protein TatB [Methyloraptor flagellatus]|uniref:Sec-independent protein translocase protein TatB n=1 Tax=Methyloraptor flagellatus TaxID=3162530 RepID=A0AAU7XDT8_9HYPH
MLDIGWSELLIIGVVALVVVGPEELPQLLRTVGQWVGKVRRMAGEFQNQMNEAIREAELDDVKKSVEDLRSLSPASMIRNELEQFTAPVTAIETEARAELAGIEAGVTAPSQANAALAEGEAAALAGAAGEGVSAPVLTETEVAARIDAAVPAPDTVFEPPSFHVEAPPVEAVPAEATPEKIEKIETAALAPAVEADASPKARGQ